MNNTNKMLNNALMPSLALPQQVEILPTRSIQTQQTVYDPNDIIAMRKAIQERNKHSAWEALSNALGSVEPKSYTGAYGVEVSNPWVSGIASALKGFDKAYTARKDAERQLADDEFELAKMMAEANKRAITTQVQDEVVKRNVKDDVIGERALMADRFAPERIQELKDLNEKAGRWMTSGTKLVSDVLNTESSQAYNEFEGKAKQYVQDQLKKIYGAQMTEQEGERFFKSMGLSPELDPNVRWALVENALNDLAVKQGMNKIALETPEQQAEQQAGKDFMMGTIPLQGA